MGAVRHGARGRFNDTSQHEAKTSLLCHGSTFNVLTVLIWSWILCFWALTFKQMISTAGWRNHVLLSGLVDIVHRKCKPKAFRNQSVLNKCKMLELWCYFFKSGRHRCSQKSGKSSTNKSTIQTALSLSQSILSYELLH